MSRFDGAPQSKKPAPARLPRRGAMLTPRWFQRCPDLDARRRAATERPLLDMDPVQ